MSRPVVRLAALAGAAAVALGMATPAVAAAMEHTATVHSIASTATPVHLDGRVVTVAMPTVHYTATTAHTDAVVTLAGAIPTTVPADNVTPAYNTVTPASASNGAIGAGATATLLLAVVLFFGVRHNKVRVSWVVTSAVLGVLLAGTTFGVMANTIAGNGVASLGSILSGF